MHRNGVKHGRIRAWSNVTRLRFPVGGSKPELDPKEWHTELVSQHGLRIDRPKGVRGSAECAYVLCPKQPTNTTFETGRCGRPRCGACHMWPVNKPLQKIKGRRKERAREDRTYYDTDWVLPVWKELTPGERERLVGEEEEEEWCQEDEGSDDWGKWADWGSSAEDDWGFLDGEDTDSDGWVSGSDGWEWLDDF
jgi:hypothetical protein